MDQIHVFVVVLVAVCSKGGTAMAVTRFANFIDEVTERRISVRVEEEQVE